MCVCVCVCVNIFICTKFVYVYHVYNICVYMCLYMYTIYNVYTEFIFLYILSVYNVYFYNLMSWHDSIHNLIRKFPLKEKNWFSKIYGLSVNALNSLVNFSHIDQTWFSKNLYDNSANVSCHRRIEPISYSSECVEIISEMNRIPIKKLMKNILKLRSSFQWFFF